MLQQADWDAHKYFDRLQMKGYAEDALQVSAPQDRVKHIFVGDSQMMSLRNALHRLNRCPEIFWDANATDASAGRRTAATSVGRLHSSTQQAPESAVDGCHEDGVASFIYWDAWVQR